MRHFGNKFIVSVVLTLIGAVLIFLNYALYAAIALVIAFFPNASEIKSYGSIYQTTNFRVHTLLLGYAVDRLIGDGSYWYTLCMFMMSFAGLVRLEFFRHIKVKKSTWVEAFGILSTYAIYFYAGAKHPSVWEGWVLPAPPILLMTYIGFNIFSDGFIRNYVKKAEAENTELGKKAPHFELENTEGQKISLNDFENANHVLLIFVRGDWCPTCHIMIRAYEKEREKLALKNVIPIGISPDSNEVNRAMMERLGWKTMLLTDDKQEVASRYGLLFSENNPETKYEQGVVLPASFLIDKTGVIRYMSRSDRAGEFLSPSLIFPIIDDLS